jgi:hypothetical protein
MEKENWFKTKKATSLFAIISFLGGFTFLNQSITVNAIIKNSSNSNLLSLIGLLLIFCSIILTGYTIRKK